MAQPNIDPIFTLVPKIGGYGTKLATGSNDYLGTSADAVLCFTAGAGGARINRIRVISPNGNAALIVRIFINNGTGANTVALGINNILWKELVLAASLGSTTVASSSAEDEPDFGLILAPGEKIYAVATITAADPVQVTIEGGDY